MKNILFSTLILMVALISCNNEKKCKIIGIGDVKFKYSENKIIEVSEENEPPFKVKKNNKTININNGESIFNINEKGNVVYRLLRLSSDYRYIFEYDKQNRLKFTKEERFVGPDKENLFVVKESRFKYISDMLDEIQTVSKVNTRFGYGVDSKETTKIFYNDKESNNPLITSFISQNITGLESIPYYLNASGNLNNHLIDKIVTQTFSSEEISSRSHIFSYTFDEKSRINNISIKSKGNYGEAITQSYPINYECN